MTKWMMIFAVVMGAGAALAQTAQIPDFSDRAKKGQALFLTNCSVCHGDTALGTDSGPPLIHFFYRPGHHDDNAIRSAVKNGVEAHHWEYGDMPPVTGISDAERTSLVAFIRELQRANGIK
ncbi:MAG: cytochrome C [Kordiimonadales bacterium]|nr:MAG: cytochrome C [Kordiimonadales bacterium]